MMPRVGGGDAGGNVCGGNSRRIAAAAGLSRAGIRDPRCAMGRDFVEVPVGTVSSVYQVR